MERIVDKKKRVDIEVSEEVLRWAAIEAAKVGISRRKYLVKCILYAMNAAKEKEESGMEFVTSL